MPQIVIGNRPLTLDELTRQLNLVDPTKQVIFGPGYMGPVIGPDCYNPIRFYEGVALEFGIYSADHHPKLRPQIVPEVKVEEFIKFLQTIPGSQKEMWKGGIVEFGDDAHVFIGLFGEVPMSVVGIYEDDLGYVTIVSVYGLR